MYEDVKNIVMSIAKSEVAVSLLDLESTWEEYVQMLKGGQLEQLAQKERRQRGILEPLSVGLIVLLVSKLVDYIIGRLSEKKSWKKAGQKVVKEEQIKYNLDNRQAWIIYSHTIKYFNEKR